MNKLIRSAVGADLSCTSPMYRPSLAWNALTLAHGCNNQEHRPSNQTDISKKNGSAEGKALCRECEGVPRFHFFLRAAGPHIGFWVDGRSDSSPKDID